VVHGGTAVVDFSDFVGFSGVKEDSLGEGGFPGINVGGNTDVPQFSDIGHIVLFLRMSGGLCRGFGECGHIFSLPINFPQIISQFSELCKRDGTRGEREKDIAVCADNFFLNKKQLTKAMTVK
jgi:hypothetical protein